MELPEKFEIGSISRRYFLSNGFDGTLTAIGVSVGSYLSGISSGILVFQIGIGAAIGLATSGVWSVWEIERAEKLAELKELEDQMLEEMEGTEVHERKHQKRIQNAVMSGIGPVLAVLISVSPFLLVPKISMFQATASSVVAGCLILFTFGAYLSKISGKNMLKSGVRMGIAGLVVAALNLILPG